MSNETVHQITRPDGVRLAARHPPGRAPTMVFLPGLRSDMTGDKARALIAFAEALCQAMLRLDYSGHGESGGRFDEGSVAVWRDDAIAIIDALAPGPVVLVGSSMGGWICAEGRGGSRWREPGAQIGRGNRRTGTHAKAGATAARRAGGAERGREGRAAGGT